MPQFDSTAALEVDLLCGMVGEGAGGLLDADVVAAYENVLAVACGEVLLLRPPALSPFLLRLTHSFLTLFFSFLRLFVK